jgi:hypothetical protein
MKTTQHDTVVELRKGRRIIARKIGVTVIPQESDTAKGEEDGEPRPPSLASLLISRHLINPRVRSFLPLFFSLESRPRGFCSGEEEAKLSRVLGSRHV